MALVAERYRLRVAVARGGHGTLHMASDLRSGAVVALKELAPAGGPDRRERDWKTLMSIPPHDHLSLPLEVIDESGERVFIVSEWIEGLSLADVIAERSVGVDEAVAILRQIASGLHHLHCAGLAHGDVTPSNIMLRGDAGGGAVLVDLSIGAGRGTPGFVAPEVARADPAGAPADVFGLAAVFVGLITGHSPPAAAGDLPHLAEDERARVHALLTAALSTCTERRPPVLELFSDMRRVNAGARTSVVGRSRTPFVGREDLIPQVLRHLRERRPVTLVAGGGYGKTRLAVEVAGTPEAVMPGDAWIVELVHVREGSEVPSAVRRTLGLPDGAPLGQQLADAFPRGALLILDNCEHVVEATREVVEEITRDAPRLAIVTTSRRPLGAVGEVLLAVPPLPVPHADAPGWALAGSPAVTLFLAAAERVRDSGGHGDLTVDRLEDVAEVCRKLGGVPLALELGASRLAAGSPAALLEDLAGHVLDIDHAGDVEPRHRTLRALLDWTFSLLSEPLRATIPRLAVFRGPFGPLAASKVASVSAADLDALTTAGILARDLADPPKYRVPEAVLEYLRERLADDEVAARDVGRRHAEWYGGQVIATFEESRRNSAGARWADDEYENITGALEWFSTHGPSEQLRRVVISLYGYWQLRGRMRDGAEWLRAAVAAMDHDGGDVPPAARVELLCDTGSFLVRIGDVAAGEDLVRRSVDEARASGSSVVIGAALLTYGGVLGTQGRIAEAEVVLTEALHHKRAAGDRGGIAAILSNLGVVARRTGRVERAVELLEECVGIQRELTNWWGLAAALNNLANAHSEAGNDERARDLHEEGLEIRRRLGDIPGTAASLANVAEIAARSGDLRGALLLHEQALELRRETGEQYEVLQSLSQLARLLVRLGHREEALRVSAELAELAAELSQHELVAEAREIAAKMTDGLPATAPFSSSSSSAARP